MLGRKSLCLVVAALGILLVGACEVTEEEADGGTYVDTFVPEPDLGVENDMTEPPPLPEYRFVMITDLSDVSGGGDGADIDAIELQKADTSSWVHSVVACALPDATACDNADAIVGPSDAFCGDPVDLSRCFSNYELADPAPYVALGGAVGEDAGAIVVEMVDPMEPGDSLVIYELGNCAISATCEDVDTVTAAAESFNVAIAETADGPWIEVLPASATEDHPAVTVTIPELPE